MAGQRAAGGKRDAAVSEKSGKHGGYSRRLSHSGGALRHSAPGPSHMQSRGTRRATGGVPPISTKETEAYDTRCKEICGFLGGRGGGEEKERWKINAKAQKGKGAKGERGGSGTRSREEREGGSLNTVAQGHGDTVADTVNHRVSVPPCPCVRVRLSPRISPRPPRLRVMALSPVLPRGVRQGGVPPISEK